MRIRTVDIVLAFDRYRNPLKLRRVILHQSDRLKRNIFLSSSSSSSSSCDNLRNRIRFDVHFFKRAETIIIEIIIINI